MLHQSSYIFLCGSFGCVNQNDHFAALSLRLDANVMGDSLNPPNCVFLFAPFLFLLCYCEFMGNNRKPYCVVRYEAEVVALDMSPLLKCW